MRTTRNGSRRPLLGWGLAALCAAAPAPANDPAKTTGPEACGECHKSEVESWRQTHHFKTFADMPRSDKARQIADAMGIKRIKSESVCLTCHFTQVLKDGNPEPLVGISCESCHGAAQDWIKIHNDYGQGTDKEKAKAAEPPEHRKERIAQSSAHGMIRPERIHDVAANCLSCHTVPNEKLVNVGGHPAGSDFELVSWLEGEVRHNFAHGQNGSNPEASPERRRVLYVVGRALDLEYGLRGMAKITENNAYAKAMAARFKAARNNLRAIQEKAKLPEVEAMLAVADAVTKIIGNEEGLTADAGKVGAAAKQFAEGNDGSGLAAIDPLIPGPDKYRGTPLGAK